MTLTGTLGTVLRKDAMENDLFFLLLLLLGIVKNELVFTITLFRAAHGSQLVIVYNST